MAGRIAYGLFPGAAILLAVGTALGQGMQKGDPRYGRTQRGTYACKVEADKDGMRAWTSPR
jgi:hypothetical protein